ncbi:piwi-like protein 2 [Sphaeramia orbicularis]|uniref:piwi-like protein 2 n=1 Tax=Sphaeramia orbicularis TaxID=375764 RepID=UPI00117D9060|nr:piwi-like protein 2 [Sphaeramia orbicularis]
MDPNKPSDFSGMTSVPLLGRGRGLPSQQQAIGRSRGLPILTEGPSEEQARSHPTAGDTSSDTRGRGLNVAATEPAIGRARGLLVQPRGGGHGRARELFYAEREHQIGVARGSFLPPHVQKPPSEPQIQDQLKETTKEVDMPTQGQGSALVSMFRGMGIEVPWEEQLHQLVSI